MVEEVKDFEVGDRIKVVAYDSFSGKSVNNKVNGVTGTITAVDEDFLDTQMDYEIDGIGQMLFYRKEVERL